MTEIGEIKLAKELGKGGTASNRFIWQQCRICNKPRWVQFVKGKPVHDICLRCAHSGTRHIRWAGGRNNNGKGYIRIWLPSNDFFYSMADCHGYVLEHRLVMAQSLKRCLHPWEVVHHINHIKTDNRFENLQLSSEDRHCQFTLLETKIRKLEAENKELRRQLKCLN